MEVRVPEEVPVSTQGKTLKCPLAGSLGPSLLSTCSTETEVRAKLSSSFKPGILGVVFVVTCKFITIAYEVMY